VRLASRKFMLALVIVAVSAYALLAGIIDGGTWVAVSSLVMTAYAAANVAAKKRQNEPEASERVFPADPSDPPDPP
jgi:hypothetical protein